MFRPFDTCEESMHPLLTRPDVQEAAQLLANAVGGPFTTVDAGDRIDGWMGWRPAADAPGWVDAVCLYPDGRTVGRRYRAAGYLSGSDGPAADAWGPLEGEPLEVARTMLRELDGRLPDISGWRPVNGHALILPR